MCNEQLKDKNYKGRLYKNDGFTVRDSAWVAENYLRGVGELAEAIDKACRARDLFQVARDTTEDNGDPAYAVEEALVKLGEAMAYAFNYHKEYLKEIEELDGAEDKNPPLGFP